uniref:Protein phosphatase 1, regulatory subunit 26 n=1 Tax=Hucho hucho TaxID=62062 RepID=A0A4W5QNY4_9TELE
MYLMNVPPVAAIHTEWKSSCGGAPGGFSGLPICFNDSDSDLSTTGTPIPEKVQMIIESLRSTHSSLDMGNETEGNQVLSGQEVGARSSQGFKARRGPVVVMGPKPKFRGPLPATHINNLLAVPEVSSNVDSESQSSDSDDSVDRGIEEAIQEYLKEKDDHKRKAEPEPSTNLLQPPKMPRRESPPTVPEPPKQQSDSNKVLTASNQVPRSVKTETQNTTPPPMKKRVKSKTPTCKENPFKKLGTTSKAAVVKKLSSFERKRGPSISNPLSDKLKCPLVKAVEEHLSDSDSSSSSDDGIEEAIQRYQQEKKKERHEGGGRQSSKPLLLLKGESDSSSSDDGIEEAIRHYQLEKQKEKKSVAKLSLSLPPKHKQVSKAAASLYCPESISTPAAAMKKQKRSKSKKPETRDVKSYLPSQTPRSSLSLIKKRLKKTLRLSLTQRRKRKEEGGSRNSSKEERETDLEMKEEAVTKPLTEHDRGSSSSVSSLKKAPLKSVKGSERRREQNGEKSSSLDSDEDLDTAIKDLLKTKKKLKKKTRDMKLKSRKGLKDDEQLTEPEPKTTSLLKTTLKVTTTTTTAAQSGNDNREKCKVSKNVSKHPQSNKKKEPLNQANETDRSEGTKGVECLSEVNNPGVFQIKEDSSSVDSDDSIEQEIRKFLAEKAKVSTTAGKTGDGKEIGNGKGKTTVPLTEKRTKTENQLAEIPRMDVTQFPDPPRQSREEQRGVPDRGVFPTTPPGNPNPTSTLETARGSCLLSALTPSFYPTALEPADGAARADKKRRSSLGSGSGDAHQYASSEMVRGHSHRSFPSPSTPLPRTDSEQWLKSQAFPPTETKEKIHNRNPFQYSSPSFGEKTATTPAYQCGLPASIYQHRRRAEPAPALDTPVSTCPDVVRIESIIKSPLVPFHCPSSSETAVVFSSPFPSLTRRPVETGPSGRYFLQGHGSGPGSRWGQLPTLTPGLSERSVVHVAKNQTTFVELSENKTNNVQVRSREVTVIQGKKERRSDLPAGERERESRKPEERGGEQIERRGEEECVDETDVSESDERTSPEKKQGFPTL